MVKKVTKTSGKERLEKSSTALNDYLKFSDALFGDKPIYEVNELKKGSPYYALAKELADEMEIDWKTMSHQDSNRIMLAMLDEYFGAIRDNDDESVRVEIKVTQIVKKNAEDTESPET